MNRPQISVASVRIIRKAPMIELVSRDTWIVTHVPGRGNAGEATRKTGRNTGRYIVCGVAR
jgi:hypothetical protein